MYLDHCCHRQNCPRAYVLLFFSFYWSSWLSLSLSSFFPSFFHACWWLVILFFITVTTASSWLISSLTVLDFNFCCFWRLLLSYFLLRPPLRSFAPSIKRTICCTSLSVVMLVGHSSWVLLHDTNTWLYVNNVCIHNS